MNPFLFDFLLDRRVFGGGDTGSGGGGGDSGGGGDTTEETIESGDTLSEIAAENGVTVDDLLDANPGITDADVIYAGDTINIPSGGGSGSGSGSGGSGSGSGSGGGSGSTVSGPVNINYTVSSGDTLSELAVANNTTIAAIAAANGIAMSDVNDINIGDSLTIPSGSNTTGESIYVDVPQSVYDEKTPDDAISVDGNYYDAFGNSYSSVDDRNYGEDQLFKQESWSNPNNWEVVVDEQGQLDQKYTGDMARPDNGAYTVPSLSTLAAAGNNDSGYDLEVIDGTTYMKDKYGQTYRDEDDLIVGEKDVDDRVESYNNASNWRIDADERGDPQLIYVGGETAPPSSAYSGGYVNVPSLMDVDSAQEEAGITGYFDITEVDGDIKFVDDYGAVHDTADDVASNEIKINEYKRPENWNVSLDESGQPFVVLDPGSTEYNLNDIDWGTSDLNDNTPSATSVKNQELSAAGAGYRINYDMESGKTLILSAVDGMPLAEMVTALNPDPELAEAYAESYNLGYTPGTAEYNDMVDATMGITIPEGGLERDATTGEIVSDTGKAFFTSFADTFANSLKGVSVAKKSFLDVNAQMFGKKLEGLGQRLAETQQKLFGAMDPNVIGALDNHIKMLQSEIAITTKDFTDTVEASGIPVNDDFWYKMGVSLSDAASNAAGEIENGDNFVVQLGGGFGSALGFITSAAGATLMGGPVAGTVAAGALGSLGNSGSVYDEAISEGASEAEALATAKLALVFGASDAVPIGKALGNLPPNFTDYFVNKLAKRTVEFAEEGVVEGAQEAFTSIMNDLAAKGIYDPERQVFTSDLTREAIIGFIVGGTANSALGAVFNNDKLAELAEVSGLTAEELEVAINNPDLYLDIAPDNKIDTATINQLLADGMNIAKITNKFKDVTGTSVNPDGTTVEVLANQSSFSDTKVVDGMGNAAIVYGNPASNSFTATPTTEGSSGVFVNITNPFTIDGINNDTGFNNLVDLFGEDKANDIKTEYNNTGTVTVTNDMVDTIVDNGYDGIVNNDTGEVTVTDNSNVSTVTEEESTTDNTVVATRPEWKNEMDQMYATMGGISLDEAQRIADQYGVPITEFGDYYKEMVAVNQPWKQAILDNYLMNGRVDFDTIKQIEADFGITTNEFNDFYKKLSIASADGFDAGILDAFEGEIDDLGGTIEVLEGQLDTAQDAANWVNSQLDADKSRNEIINTLKSEGGFSQTEAAKLYDSIYGFRETIGGLETDITGLETDVDTLTGERDFAEGAYGVVNDALASETDRQDIINNLVENGFDSASAASLVDTVQQIRDTDAQLRSEKGFAQGAYNYVETRLAEKATREEIFAELKDNGYTDATANTLLDDIQGVFADKDALVTDVSFAQNAYALVNAQLDAGKTTAEIVELLGNNNFPTDLAQGLVDSIQTYRDTIGGLETDVETGEGLTQFAQQAYDYVNGQLDAETSLEDIVADLVENGYSEAGANALVENIDGMRTNLSAAETSLGTANANQLFGQTAYSFVNEQLELIANQDPDAEVQLSENDIIAKLVENGFSEDNAATLVGNVSTIRTTETTLRDQIDGLEAENTFAEGAYDFVNTRLDAMLGQDPDAEVQITPESIVNELVENGFDQTTAQNLVDSVTTVKDKVADLGMQLDTLGTEASFAQRAYSYVNSMFDQGKTAEEISASLVEKGFTEDTASTLVTSVDGTRTTLAGLETDLGTAQDQRTFAQRAFEFVNAQLDGEVSVDDIRQDLLDNGFSELDADALITDATDIRSNTDLLEANNSFAQGAYGFINEQLEAGSKTTDIIQEMIDNGFGYDKAQSMVTNVVNVQNEVDTLSDALGIMEGRAEFAQTSFDYINNQLDNNVTEDALLNDLVENYGFTAENAQNFVDSVQETRFQESELQRIKTATTTGTTFDFASATAGAPEDGGDDEDQVTPTTDGPFAPITRPDPTTTTTPATAVGGVGDGGGTYVGGQAVELDEFGNPILTFDPFGRPVGTYTTQPTQPVGPFDAYAMQMPEAPAFNPQQARLGPQPTQVTLDEAGFITEPVSYIPEQAPTDPTPYYSPQFNQFTEVPVGYGATTVPPSFIQQPQPAINEVTQEGIGAFLGRTPPVGVA
jgi:LysM repeat protein/SOS response regulatory protein OraA/RecX